MRVSTALVLIAILLSPFAIFGVEPPWYPEGFGFAYNFFGWMYYELPVMLLAVAILIALLTSGVLAYRRNWKGTMQCLFEVGVCILGALLAPAY